MNASKPVERLGLVGDLKPWLPDWRAQGDRYQWIRLTSRSFHFVLHRFLGLRSQAQESYLESPSDP